MKRLSTLFLSLALCMAASASHYPGNDSTGFGGPVGMGSLDITFNSPNLTITLNKGTNAMNDVLVIYIDASAGGFTSTSTMMDYSTGLMAAISGYDGSQPNRRSTLNFASGFAPDLAIAMMPNGNGGAVAVALGTANHTVLGMPTLTNNGNANASTYSITMNVSQLVQGGNVLFSFVGTYISNTGYRSNEAFGMPMTGFSQGWNTYTQTTPPLVFNSTVTPITLGAFTGAVKEGAAMLNWSTKTESNANAFEVQRSANGGEWSTIGSVRAANNINGAQYAYTDNTKLSAAVYYRLRMVDNDGSYKYSNVIRLTTKTRGGIKVLGNPAQGKVALNIVNSSAVKYNLELLSMDGRRVSAMSYNHAGGVSSVDLPLKGAQRGVYILKASSETGTETQQVLVK